MKNKLVIILEVLIIFGCFIFYLIGIAIPEYKESKGSSDRVISVVDYKGMYEFKLDSGINFMVVLDKRDFVYHLMFFDNNSQSLYNQNIENNNLDKALLKIIEILIKDDYLTNDTNLSIISYDINKELLENSLIKAYKKYNLNYNVSFSESNVQFKANMLGIRVQANHEDYIRNLDFYSKDFIRTFRADKVIKRIKNDFSNKSLNYALLVYEKLEEELDLGVISNSMTDVSGIILSSIKLDNDISPTTNSWFYVENDKIYAYVEFLDNNKKYGYCFNGSKDSVREGEC